MRQPKYLGKILAFQKFSTGKIIFEQFHVLGLFSWEQFDLDVQFLISEKKNSLPKPKIYENLNSQTEENLPPSLTFSNCSTLSLRLYTAMHVHWPPHLAGPSILSEDFQFFLVWIPQVGWIPHHLLRFFT